VPPVILAPNKWPALMIRERRTEDAIKRPKPEGIVVRLRQVEVLIGQDMPRIDVIRQIGVTACIKSDNENSLLRRSGTGSKPLGRRQPTSSQGLLGRTDTAKVSTGECETNC